MSYKWISTAFADQTADSTMSQMLGETNGPSGEKMLCEGCGKKIVKEFVEDKELQGAVWHPSCYSKSLTCIKCKKSIAGATVTITNEKKNIPEHYHPKCFTCSNCKEQLEESYTMGSKGPICRNCSRPKNENERKTVSGKGGKINLGPSKKQIATNMAKQEAFGNTQKGKEVCFICNKKFGALDSAVEIPKRGACHADCFKCNSCGGGMENGFARKGNNFICANCAKSGSSSGKKGSSWQKA